MEYHFRNLVFEGGGVKGIAYVGALEVLEKKGILKKIKRVGGTSAGAINAVILGLGFTFKETKEILENLNFQNLLDDSWGIIKDTNRLFKEFGWYRGDYFRNWIANLIAEKTGNSESTFLEVHKQKDKYHFRDLYFLGTNLSTGFGEVFSHEHSPHMCIADAVRISMSIPIFFSAKTNFRGDIYTDGGLLNNYPIKLFDQRKYVEQYYRTTDYYENCNTDLTNAAGNGNRFVYNKETLGFRLDTAEEIALFKNQSIPQRREIRNFFSYSWCVIETILQIQQHQHLHSDDWQRTIYIDTLGVGMTDFDLSDLMKQDLIQSGNDHTAKYFEWYDDEKNDPAINRP